MDNKNITTSHILGAGAGFATYAATKNLSTAGFRAVFQKFRLKVDDKIDPVSGIIIHRKTGDFVNKNDVLFELHHNRKDINNVIENLNSSYIIDTEKTERNKLIKYIVN